MDKSANLRSNLVKLNLAAPINLMTNGDFEAGATGWTAYSSATIADETTTVRRGGHSLKIITSGSIGGGGFAGGVQRSVSGLTVGRVYMVDVWINTAAAGAININVFVDGNSMNQGTSYTSSGTGWECKRVAFTAAATTHTFYVRSTGLTKTFYIDQARFYDIDFIPSETFIALFTSDPTIAGTGTEVTGGSYARQYANWGTESNGILPTASPVAFPAMPAATVTHWAVFDAVTGGRLLYFGQLEIPLPTTSGQNLTFAAGNIQISEA